MTSSLLRPRVTFTVAGCVALIVAAASCSRRSTPAASHDSTTTDAADMMIFSKSGSSAGIGFAVPMTSILRVVPQLIKNGRVERAGLGVQLLPDNYTARARIKGVIVAKVQPGSPADAAGLRGLTQTPMGDLAIGDVIIGIDDHAVQNYDDLYNTLDGYKVGDTVKVKLRRGNDTVVVELKLTEVG